MFLFLFGSGSFPPIYSWNVNWMVSDVFWKSDVGLMKVSCRRSSGDSRNRLSSDEIHISL